MRLLFALGIPMEVYVRSRRSGQGKIELTSFIEKHQLRVVYQHLLLFSWPDLKFHACHVNNL